MIKDRERVTCSVVYSSRCLLRYPATPSNVACNYRVRSSYPYVRPSAAVASDRLKVQQQFHGPARNAVSPGCPVDPVGDLSPAVEEEGSDAADELVIPGDRPQCDVGRI